MSDSKYVRGNYKYEVARFDKVCRMTVDMSTPRSLLCGWLIDVIKDELVKTRYWYKGVPVQFVKSPNPEVLSKAYSDMFCSSLVLYFSDDVAGSLECADGILRFNMDISSCDSSNGIAIFTLLLKLAPEPYTSLIRAAIDQCRLPIKIGYGSQSILAKPTTVFEYSGSILTTLLNNMAVLMLVTHILRDYDRKKTVSQNKRAIEDRLLTASHKVTMEWCEEFEDIQFLKTSPCFTVSGEIVAILNLGVILRACGRTNGDYAGRGCLVKRISKHNSAWVLGLKHAGNHALLRVLQQKFPPRSGTKPIYSNKAAESFTDGNQSILDEVSVARRYRLDRGEYDEMLQLLVGAGIGDGIVCSASRKILLKDYSITCPT